MGKTVRSFLQFGHMGCLRTLSTCGNVDTESLAAPSDSNWSVRFQETGDPFAELAHADFDRSHRDAPRRECTPMCTQRKRAGIRVVRRLREVDAVESVIQCIQAASPARPFTWTSISLRHTARAQSCAPPLVRPTDQQSS